MVAGKKEGLSKSGTRGEMLQVMPQCVSKELKTSKGTVRDCPLTRKEEWAQEKKRQKEHHQWDRAATAYGAGQR